MTATFHITRKQYDAMLACFPQFMASSEWLSLPKKWSLSGVTVLETSYKLEHLFNQLPTGPSVGVGGRY